MIVTHLKLISKVVWVGVVMLSALNANQCQESIVDRKIESLLKLSKVQELKRLYKSCKSRKTHIAYLIRRGDESRDNGLLKSATADYREALALIEENHFRIFEEYKEYLEIELGITSKDIITSEELEDYITTRGGTFSTFGKLKGIPLNFKKADSKIREGVNLSQAKEIGKLLSNDKYIDTIIYITGYTDTKGSREYNKKLSKQRADSLKKYLVDNFHLKEKNLMTDGLGENFPIKKKSGKEDYYRSRRVTLEYGE